MFKQIENKTTEKPLREFHISRNVRDKYGFSESLFSLSGNVIFSNILAARTFVQKINVKRDLISYPEQVVKTGQLIAMGLIDEILHYVVGRYVEETDPSIIEKALSFLTEKLGDEKIEKTLYHFIDQFPPLDVYKRNIDSESYLKGATLGTANRQIILEEMLLLWLANMNPAFSPFFELFDDSSLKKGYSVSSNHFGPQIIFRYSAILRSSPRKPHRHAEESRDSRSPLSGRTT